jgi:hypothetical protein
MQSTIRTKIQYLYLLVAQPTQRRQAAAAAAASFRPTARPEKESSHSQMSPFYQSGQMGGLSRRARGGSTCNTPMYVAATHRRAA